MTKKKSNLPLLESDKQTKPLSGEVSTKDARAKAALFAAQEKALISSGKNNPKK